jgi:hypothetical protein
LEANAVAIPQTFQNEALNKVLEGKEERFAGEHGAQRSHSIGTNYPIADLLVVHVEITCGFFYGVVGDFIRLELRPFHKPLMRRRSIAEILSLAMVLSCSYENGTRGWHVGLQWGTLLLGHRRMAENS